MNFRGLLRILCVLPLLLALAASLRAQPPQPMIEPHAQAMPLLPFLDFLVDESMAMDIEEAARLNEGWQPLALDKLPRAEGIVWLRFTIAPLAADARPRTFLLDMGESVPGEPVLYDSVQNELSGAREWRENLPAHRNILLLPEAGQEAIPIYIRLDGLPGPWFAPMIRTPQNAASNLSSLARAGAILALAVIMLLCLLRGLGEKGQWRYWTALFVGVALAQAVLGMPRETQHFSATDLASILCPGLALMFLPHVGRHLMQTKTWSRSIDIQLFALSLPCAILAVLPLVPGWNWLDRWLDLWPAGTLLFVPTALGAWLMGIPGSRRFLLACLLPPVFVGFALSGMEFGLPANFLAACPIWAVALSALLLAAMRAPVQAAAVAKTEQAQEKAQAMPAVAKKKRQPQLEMPVLALNEEENIINLDMPLNDPNLRLIPSQPEEMALAEEEENEPAPPEPQRKSAAAILEADEALEMALWKPVDDILREAAALEQCALPPSAREAAAGMKAAARRLGAILSGEDAGEGKSDRQPGVEVFNLQRILRNVHDSVAAIAECSGTTLSWYMPPHLPQEYKGDGRSLENTLRLLLESAVRCSRHGAIKLSARGVPGSAEPGHLLFSVVDNGNGYPPHDRSSLALAKAWELTGKYEGYLSVEASEEGAMVAFTARFALLDAETADKEKECAVIVASADPGDRRQLARILEAIPCAVMEASSAVEVLAHQNQSPSALLVAQGRLARPSSGDMVREFCRLARQSGICQSHVLAITTLDESQWPLLKASGFTHAMLEPVDPEVLRRTVAGMLKMEEQNVSAEPFHPEGAALDGRQVREEIAPTMLIDQKFSIKTVFEGPEWLGKDDSGAGDAPVQRQQPVPPEVRSVREPAPKQAKQEPALKPEPKPSQMVHAPKAPLDESQERVDGAVHEASRKPEAVPRVSSAPADAVEWVGEPMPIEKPVTDFIVGVENNGNAHTAVKDFMEGSASLVSSALSGMLSGQAEEAGSAEKEKTLSTQAPQAAAPVESLRSSLDPEVLGLLDRLDGQMRRANGFYQAQNCAGVATTIAQMARDGEFFGLRHFTRMAQCVEKAARAGDMGALKDLLPELDHAVERTRILIMQKQGGKNR